MRYIGIDFGDARIGFASGDPGGILATAQGFIRVNGINDAAEKSAVKIKELDGGAVVLGLPLNMDGTGAYRADRTKRFAGMLREKTGLEIILFDERLTTSQAVRYLDAGDYKKKKRAEVVDQLSAQIILQAFLDKTNEKNKGKERE